MILGLLQIVLIAFALYGFNQEWHVEEERPIGSGEDYGAGAAPDSPRADALRERLQLPVHRTGNCNRTMPEVGLEPTSPQGQSILSRSRMPIPPLRRAANDRAKRRLRRG